MTRDDLRDEDILLIGRLIFLDSPGASPEPPRLLLRAWDSMSRAHKEFLWPEWLPVDPSRIWKVGPGRYVGVDPEDGERTTKALQRFERARKRRQAMIDRAAAEALRRIERAGRRDRIRRDYAVAQQARAMARVWPEVRPGALHWSG